MSIFERLNFQYEFRKHQNMMLSKFEKKLKKNKKNTFTFHLVSPPGSGKTIVGLEMILRLGKPALIICPNTTIQGQWTEKVTMFFPKENVDGLGEEINTDPKSIKKINIFTYQMLSVTSRDDEAFIRLSEDLWAESVSKSYNVDFAQALLRIDTMRQTNLQAYKNELSKYARKIRQSYLNEVSFDLSKVLHTNTLALIDEIKKNHIETVVFDEAHHLQSYWALVMREIIKEIKAVNVIGLTATPPIGEDREKIGCYTSLLGEIDYQIPTPAVIKDGMLAPYQDLVYFCVPTQSEFEYIKNCHQKFKNLITKFNMQNSDFYFWIEERIVRRKLICGGTQKWNKFINARPNFSIAGVKYLLQNKYSLPLDITITEIMYEPMSLEDWICLIEDYALNLLKLSNKHCDNNLYIDIKNALRDLGFVLTETGIRSHGSLLDRILAYSKSKLEAVIKILKVEMAGLGDDIRVAIITDFEVSNSLTVRKSDGIIDNECGGAVSVMKEIVSDSTTDNLNAVMVTGKSLICDDDFADEYIELGLKWAQKQNYEIALSIKEVEFDKYVSIEGSGKDWNSKVAVLLTTYLLEIGATKCIVGTRGLLSEGWDSVNLNTLIDLSVVTTYASVNQLRGRSIRKSDDHPFKVANNWDVICVAPQMEKGYNDLNRLYRKHDQFYGICDDGQIQIGVNHIDPSLALSDRQLTIEEFQNINVKMLDIAVKRKEAYDSWKIGQPFDNTEVGCCEIKLIKPIQMRDASIISNEKVILKKMIKRNIKEFAGITLLMAAAGVAASFVLPAAIPVVGFCAFLGIKTYRDLKSLWFYGKENFFQMTVKSSISDVAKCVFYSLLECQFINDKLKEDSIFISERSDGTIRAYLNASDQESNIFSNSLSQVFAPIEGQRYAVQRFEVLVPKGNFDKFMYLFKYSMDDYSPILAGYQPLPELFNIKQKALIFEKYWNKFVSPGDVVFLKGEKGKEVIANYGRVNSLGAKTINIKIWK
ncbi:UNVERIFIED_CONTAM: DNA or RNA helicases of superfamily II [Acetivibrio alkalicellulosi]